MDKVRDYLRGRGLGYYLAVPAAALAAAAVLLYQKYGVTEFSPELFPEAIWMAVGAAVLCVFSLFADFKVIKYISYLMALYAFMQYISSQITYIANVFVSIDGTSFSTEMMTTFICFLASWLIALIAAVTDHWKPWRKGEKNA